MAGTNDLLRLAKGRPGYTVPNIVESMNVLLAQILYMRPTARVIVAGVVDSPSVRTCDVAQFEGLSTPGCGPPSAPNVSTLVAAYRARGFHISFAPGMSDAVPRDGLHFPDGIHPSGPGGYSAVARVWVEAIEGDGLGSEDTAFASN
jgi:hypothetical protein